MATFAKQLFCLFVIVLHTCCQTESREIKFFSKYVHPKKEVLSSSPTPAPQPITSHISYVPTPAPVEANYDSAPTPAPETLGANYGPTLAPVPAPTTLGSDSGYVEGESNWYYGLYARGTSDSPKEKAEFSTEFSTKNPVLSNDDFPSEQENVFDEDREENGYFNNLSEENGFWNSNHKGYKSSKTYYNVDHNNYSPRGHELARENNYEEEYYNGNYGKSKYEFDSMEEYEKHEGYVDVQREFIP